MVTPTERSIPFDGTGADAGPYDSDYFGRMLEAMIGSYTRRTTAGILLGVGDGTNESLLVTETSPASLGVTVYTGWAVVNGRMYQLTADTTVSIPQNTDGSGDDRIDSIVAQLNITNREIRLVDRQGTVAPSPVAPTLTQTSTVWEIRLANVLVQNLAIQIDNADIDTTVRAYARQTLVKEGGLAPLTSVADGELPMGISADNYGLIPAISDFAWLIGDSAKSPKARFVSMQPHIIGGNTGVALGTSAAGTVIPLASPAVLNPNSWISSIASNQFFLTAGYYLISAICWIENVSGAARNNLIWIHNATTTAVAAEGITSVGKTIAENSYPAFINRQVVQSNGTDAFELRGFSSGALTNAVAGQLTPSLTGGVASFPRQIFIQKIKI